MANIGTYNNIPIARVTDFGVYLDAGDLGEILMPQKYVPENHEEGDIVKVFIYNDSEDRLVATTETPLAQVGDIAVLKAVEVNRIGAFFDWGLQKDLLVPYSQQEEKIEKGKYYPVYIYVDNQTKRIVGSNYINRYLDNTLAEYEAGQKVNLLVCGETEIGYKVVIENEHRGMLYKNEVFGTIRLGDKLEGYVKKVREDEKIDVSLHKFGYRKVETLSDKIILKLNEENGFIPLNDKSEPDAIYKMFEVSKKTYKKAIGALYKSKKIKIEKDGIYLL